MPSNFLIAAGTVVVLGSAYYFNPWRRVTMQTCGALKGRFQPISFTLMSKIPLTHDTVLLRFAFPDDNDKMGLPIGNHILLKNQSIRRPYTPISSPDVKGQFELAVKIYHPNDEFPKGGVMSQYLDSLKEGSEITGFGPFGTLHYVEAPGVFKIRRGPRESIINVRNLHLIAGGTGITPMFQMIQAILVSDDSMKINLIFANKTTNDIILKDQLEDLVKKFPKQFKISYVITRQKEAEQKGFYFGKLNEKCLKDNLPIPTEDCLVAVCGPPKMSKETCLPALQTLGFKTEQIHCF